MKRGKNNFFGYTLWELVIAMTLLGILMATVLPWFSKKMEKKEHFFQGFQQLAAFVLRAKQIRFQEGKIFLTVEKKEGYRLTNEQVSVAVVSHYDPSMGSNVQQFCWPSVHSQTWCIWNHESKKWDPIVGDQTIDEKTFFKWVLKDSKDRVLEEFIFQPMNLRTAETLEKESK